MVGFEFVRFFSNNFDCCLAVQNERGPRQPFPDRHMHITGSFPLKSEVGQ